MLDNNGKAVSPGGEDLLRNIGAVFKSFRENEDYSQRDAALLFGGSQASVSDLENGKTDIHILTLQRWANFYGYDVELHFARRTDEIDDLIMQAALELQEEARE